MVDEQSCDVLICGAGPVGACLALALQADGRKVRVIDLAEAAPQGDDRSLGLTVGTVRLLTDIGVWLQVRGAEPIRALHISEKGRFGRSRITAAEHGLEALGAVVPAQSLHDALDAALENAGVTVQRQTQLVAMSFADEARAQAGEGPHRHCRLQHGDGSETTCSAALVVGADGVNSSVRAQLGIDAEVEDYGHIALVAQMNTSRDVEGCAYERFSAEGPLAVMPRGSRRVGTIWMVGQQRAQQLRALSDEDFSAAFQQEFGWRLGKLSLAAPLLSWPLKRMRAQRLTGPRAILMGNAAGAFHPVAAQSFNLAIRDVEALRTSLHGVADPGEVSLLAAYEQSRSADHRRIEAMTDGLVKVFTQKLPGLAQLRSLGLVGLGVLPALQSRMVQRSSGAIPPLQVLR